MKDQPNLFVGSGLAALSATPPEVWWLRSTLTTLHWKLTLIHVPKCAADGLRSPRILILDVELA